MNKTKESEHKLFLINTWSLERAPTELLLKDLNSGWTIVSAVTTGNGAVQYIIKKS